jgi:hypothetical protein
MHIYAKITDNYACFAPESYLYGIKYLKHVYTNKKY